MPVQIGQDLSLTGEATSVAFAPDGRTLVIGSFGSGVVLWDITDRNRPRQLGQPLTGH